MKTVADQTNIQLHHLLPTYIKNEQKKLVENTDETKFKLQSL